MRYLRNTNTDPYFNMAFDEYALEQLPLDEPLFFLWQNRPSVIVGLNQDVYAEVDIDYLQQHDIALVRRVTGGGAVYHDLGNLNYTIVGRTTQLEHDYPEYTRHMLYALQALGIQAELSGRNDILVDGRKVSGYAKRVYKDRLMVHGTLMYDVDIARLTAALTPSKEKLCSKGIASVRSRVANLKDYLPHLADIHALQQALERHLSNEYADAEYLLDDAQQHAIAMLGQSKFASAEWIYNRRRPATLQYSARLACGIVEVHLEISGTHLSSCRFYGDFLGNLSAADIEQMLVGCEYSPSGIAQCLAQCNIAQYFDGVTLNDLIQLLYPNT